MRFPFAVGRISQLVLGSLLAVGLGGSSASAQTADKPAANSAPAEGAAAPIVVPDGTPAELLAFVRKIKTERPATRDYAEVVRHVVRVQEAVVVATDKLASGKPNDTEAADGISEKISALMMLARLNAEGADGKLKSYLDDLSRDARPFVPPLAKIYKLGTRLQSLDHGNKAEVEELAADVREHIKTAKLDARNLSLAFQTARGAEQAGLNKLAGEIYLEFAAAFAKSDDPQVVDRAKKLEGAARLVNLVGNTMELKGKKLDGSDFNWAAYRGKTVLVDFWATWCGPCIAELPNLKEAHAKYKDRGFDVVGISLDTDKDRVDSFIKRESLGWTTLFSADEKATGWNHPLAEHYGIMAIPRAILVDKNGKVVSLSARGEELWDLLAVQIGPAEVKKPEKDDAPKEDAPKGDAPKGDAPKQPKADEEKK